MAASPFICKEDDEEEEEEGEKEEEEEEEEEHTASVFNLFVEAKLASRSSVSAKMVTDTA